MVTSVPMAYKSSGDGVFGFQIALRHDDERPVACLGSFRRLHLSDPADEQRRDHAREQHRVAHRQQRTLDQSLHVTRDALGNDGFIRHALGHI